MAFYLPSSSDDETRLSARTTMIPRRLGAIVQESLDVFARYDSVSVRVKQHHHCMIERQHFLSVPGFGHTLVLSRDHGQYIWMGHLFAVEAGFGFRVWAFLELVAESWPQGRDAKSKHFCR